MRYMPLALSLNSDCLVTALCITKSTRDRDHSFQTRTSQFLYSCPQPLGHVQCMTAGTFALVTQGMGRQTKKKRKNRGRFPAGKQCTSAGLEQIPLKLSLCSAMQEHRVAARRTWQLTGPGPREGGRPTPELQPDWTSHYRPCHCPAPTGQVASTGLGSTHNPAVVESVFCYKSKKKSIFITKLFKSLSISSTETKCNKLLCFHIL